MKKQKNRKMITTVVLMFALLSSAFFVFSNTATVKAQITSIPSNLLQYEWPEPFHDAQHTYFNPGPAPSTASIAWKARIPGVSGYMVAINGLVFAQARGRTYALDGGTGNIVWSNNVTGNMQKIDSTYMMIGRNCVRISDGGIVWTTTLPISGQSWSTGVGYVPEEKMFLDAQHGMSLPDPSKPPTLYGTSHLRQISRWAIRCTVTENSS